GAAVEKGPGLDDAAPLDAPAPHGRSLLRMELRARRRVQSVATDEHVAGPRWERSAAAAVDEPGRDAPAVLLERDQVMAGKYVRSADPLLNRVEQDHLQVAAVDGVLRPGIAGGEPAGPRPARPAVPVVIAELRGLDRRRRQDAAEAELDQLAHGVRLQIDADAEPPDVGDRF